MDLVKKDRSCWHVFPGSGAARDSAQIRGEIHLDSACQVRTLVLRGGTPEERLAIKRLACSHLLQYVRDRTTSNGIFVIEHRDPKLTETDSDTLMSFGRIPDAVQSLDEAALDRALDRHVRTVDAAYPSCVDAVADALLRVRASASEKKGAELGIVSAKRHDFLNRIDVVFGVPTRRKRKFRLWKSLSPESDLHVIPPYHPVLRANSVQAGLINGDTDALITRGESGIVSVFCPPQAVASTDLFGSWKVNHPFYAEGCHLRIEIDLVLFQSASACEGLTELLVAALELDHTYMAVSGGFHPPHDRYRRGPRGSEEMAVWEYRTLEREGKLEGAIVPSWLKEEGWLERSPRARARR